jgi:glycosyltransferase involved in cell wall biosynthesis
MPGGAGAPWRVAYVIGELEKGGAEYQLYELLRGLDRSRFEPAVCVLAAHGYWAAPIRKLGVEVTEIAGTRSADPGRLRRLRGVLRAARPHLLHTILWSGNSYGRLAAIGLGIPVVIAAERNLIARPPWQVRVERLLDRWTACYLVNSQSIADRLVGRQGLAAAKMRVVHNGIDLARVPAFSLERATARSALGFDPARRLVAQVGRLEAQKDYPTFLEAARQVAAAVPDVDFLIAGVGALQADLEAMAARLGLGDRVRFLGLRHDVPALLGGVDVLALTSRWEGLPNVVIEAMATGAVAVATDVGGCPELIVPGETGFLVPPGEPVAVARAILDVLETPTLAARLAAAARRRIEDEFAVGAMVAKTAAVYDACLQAAGLAASA